MRRPRFTACLLGTLLLASIPVYAGQDDDAPFKSDGKSRNAADPIYFGDQLADFPTHADPATGLRIFPPTATELFAGQRFDLRVETQLPAAMPPRLKQLTVNGKDVTAAFLDKIQRQGSGLESGTPASPQLLGASARNLAFDKPGRYEVAATVEVDGAVHRIANAYKVAAAPNPQAPGAARRVVFFLTDGAGFFHLHDVPGGPQLLRVQPAVGPAFTVRVLVPQGRAVFFELDQARQGGPEHDEY